MFVSFLAKRNDERRYCFRDRSRGRSGVLVYGDDGLKMQARRDSSTTTIQRRRGLTLLELVVVVVVLAVLAAIMVPAVSKTVSDSREQITRSTMRNLQELLLNRYSIEMRGALPLSPSLAIRSGLPGPHPDSNISGSRIQGPQLHFLFVNPENNLAAATFSPETGRGWRGPYLMSGAGKYPGVHAETALARGFTRDFGEDGDDAPLDAWGNPLVIVTTNLSSYTNDPTVLGVLVSAGANERLQHPSDDDFDDRWLPLR